MKTYDWLESSGGRIYLVFDGREVERVLLGEREWSLYSAANETRRDIVACQAAITQMAEYFAGERREFSLRLKISGAPFSRRVWAAVSAIPYGEVRSYGEVAAALGNAKACRAVGMANHKNPLPILIPCHRVIGKDGRLTGYKEFGVDFKRRLLELERCNE